MRTFAIFFLGLLTARLATAQVAPASSLAGEDIVVLMDESGSMMGSRAHPMPNDPSGVRVQLVERYADGLLGVSEQNLIANRPLGFRLCIIEFGSQARLVQDWFDIVFDSTQQAGDQLQRINDRIRASVDPYKNWGNTDHLSALKLAEHQFQALLKPGTGRRPILALITDGPSYVDEPPYADGRGGFFQKPYTEALIHEIGTVRSTAGAGGIPLHFVVLGIRGTGDDWKEIQPFWKHYADTVMVSGATDTLLFVPISPSLGNLSRAYGPSDTLRVPCYTGKLRLTAFLFKPSTRVRIADPTGAEVPLDPYVKTRGTNYVTFEIDHPARGDWRFLDAPERYDVRVELYYQKVVMLLPSIDRNSLPKMPHTLRCRVESLDGQPFQLDAACPVLAYALMVGAGSQTDSISMVPSGQAGEFALAQPWTPPAPGKYQLTIRGIAQSSGQPTIAFETKPFSFAISEQIPLAGDVVAPQIVVTWFGRTSTALNVHVRNLDNDAMGPSPQELSSYPDSVIQFAVVHKADTLQKWTSLRSAAGKGGSDFDGVIKVKGLPSATKWYWPQVWRADTLKLMFRVNDRLVNRRYGIFRCGSRNLGEYVCQLQVRESRVLTALSTVIGSYLAINLFVLLWELLWWLSVALADYAMGLRRAWLFYQEDPAADMEHRDFRRRHYCQYGFSGRSVWTFLFPLRAALRKLKFWSATVPFATMNAKPETLHIVGMEVRRLPFSRQIKVRIFPDLPEAAPESDDLPPEELERREARERKWIEKERRKVYVLGRRPSLLPRGIGRLGAIVE